MKVTATILIAGLFLFFGSFCPAYGDVECSGNACNDVVFSFNNGCYVVKNLGTRRVKITMGRFSFTLQRGESKTPAFGTHCLKSFFGGATANHE